MEKVYFCYFSPPEKKQNCIIYGKSIFLLFYPAGPHKKNLSPQNHKIPQNKEPLKPKIPQNTPKQPNLMLFYLDVTRVTHLIWTNHARYAFDLDESRALRLM